MYWQARANASDCAGVILREGNARQGFQQSGRSSPSAASLCVRHQDGKLIAAPAGDCIPRAKTTFRKSAKPYRDYYDGDTREIVGEWYAREIKLLDYAF